MKELLYWSYACLAMAHSAVSKEQERYAQVNYIIRAKLYKGLMDGTMDVGSIFQDEKVKISQGDICSYCGGAGPLALDHVIPRFSGGQDRGDNLIYACRKCNSSKGKKDLMEWMQQNKRFPSLMVLRRYLKLAIDWSVENDAMNLSIESARASQLPFNVDFVPTQFPTPDALCLVAQANA
ncbi:MAG: HNH endonuclease [Thiohalocapsa sp.]|nr:HNH endonuclease [Thiohalocapsa sp.]